MHAITTDNPAGPQIDHAAYPKLCRTRSEAELRFVIADCQAALRAMPDNPKAGWYLDEINYCADELARRARGGKRHNPRPTVEQIAAAAAEAAWRLTEGLDA
jgi:hypothetical protein